MTREVVDPREKFVGLVNLKESRVQLYPHVIFVCGGPVDPQATNNHSIRNMFMNLSGAVGGAAEGFVLAENFKDWQSGYSNLSDFENDIAYLSSMVVVFLESEGALTEFGLFFGNPELRNRLVAVVHKEFHNSESFIKFGLLNPLEIKDQSTVKVFTIDHRKIDEVEETEVSEILEDILVDCEEKDKTEKFNTGSRGHQIFLIFQLVNMMRALTISEINKFMKILGFDIPKKDLKSALYVLQKFNFLEYEKRSSQYFYVAANTKSDRIDLKFNKDGDRRYDPSTVKLEIYDFYEKSRKTDRTNLRRLNILNSSQIDGQA